MMSVTQESVKSAFCMQIPGVCQSQGIFSNIVVINCHFGGHFVCILALYRFERFCHITHLFSLITGLHLGRHLGYIEMLNDARVASLDISRTLYALPESTKKKSLKSSSRSS